MARGKRSFGADFKREVVLELLSGETSAAALCRRCELSPNSSAGWKIFASISGAKRRVKFCRGPGGRLMRRASSRTSNARRHR